jgi:23S rRNA pseudouridine2605 synthase
LAANLMHPSSLVKKTYVAEVKGRINEKELSVLRKGVELGDFITAPADVKVLEVTSKFSVIKLTIHEGKNRQVRRMCKAVGHEVNKLQRVKYANITLDGIGEGSLRELTDDELQHLRSCV